MTGRRGQRKVSSALILDQPSIATTLLAPLLKGKPVSLSVIGTRLPKKTRTVPPVLVIVPGELVNAPHGVLLVSFPPYGSEWIAVGDMRGMSFARLGLPFNLSSVLAKALTHLYLHGGTYGHSTTSG